MMVKGFEWRGRFPLISPRLKEIVGQADPLEVLFLAVFAMSCFVQVLTNTAPSSVEALLNPVLRTVWLLILGLGALIALTGIFWPGKKTDALLIESVGVGWVSLMIVGYGIMQLVAAYLNDRLDQNFMSGALVVVLGIAFGLKQRRIQRVIDGLKT